jgi:PAS domain S-box-containing protein
MLDLNSIKDNLVNFIVEPMFVAGVDKKIRLANEAIHYLLGYEEGELFNKDIEIVFADVHDSILRKSNLGKLINTGTILNVETCYQSKSGRKIPVLFSSNTLKDDLGNILYIVCTAMDITERKASEEEMRSAYQRLKETQHQLIQAEKLKAIGLLASGVAHEVKNPLGIILQGINYFELKLICQKETEPLGVLAMMKDGVERANVIVNRLLDFSRAKNLDLKLENINIIIEKALDLVKANIKFENIAVILQLDRSIPPVFVDKSRIEQVLVNLFLNAVQALPAKGGKISVRSYGKILNSEYIKGSDDTKSYFKKGQKVVVIEIADTGLGMPAEIFKKIFNPFVTTKDTGGGSGMGLYVSKNIIDMHEGSIEIESEEDKGTKATILFSVPGEKEALNGKA